MSKNSKIEELTLEDLLLAALASAQHAQRKNSIDEVHDLFDFCSRITKEKLPPEVVRFLSRYKRPRGRQYSERQLSKNFYNNPNRIAAHFAAIYVAKWRNTTGRKSKRRGPYKVQIGPGSTATVHSWAAQRAIEFVNNSFNKVSGRRARLEIVLELLRKGRVNRPVLKIDDEGNDDH